MIKIFELTFQSFTPDRVKVFLKHRLYFQDDSGFSFLGEANLLTLAGHHKEHGEVKNIFVYAKHIECTKAFRLFLLNQFKILQCHPLTHRSLTL